MRQNAKAVGLQSVEAFGGEWDGEILKSPFRAARARLRAGDSGAQPHADAADMDR